MEKSKQQPEKRRKAAPNTRAGKTMLYVLLGLAVCIALFLILLYPVTMVGAPQEASIKIPHGATEQTVRDSLTKYMGKDYAATVIRLARLRNPDYSRRHGAYTVPKGANALSTMRRLTSGAQTPIRITVNGFRSLPTLVERVAEKLELTPDSLYKFLNDKNVMAQYGLTPESALALFIDDTYEVYWNTPAADVIKKIGKRYKRLWNEERVDLARDMGLSPEQVMIIASITDEETNNISEKGTIARLYLNRFLNNMKLQADPTVRFALGNYTIRRISKADLQTDSPYNTYLHAGLPPGPIRTTSEETVREILHSHPNNYLYMCAKEDFSGSHNFASTYDQHLRNAIRYQQALDERGILR